MSDATVRRTRRLEIGRMAYDAYRATLTPDTPREWAALGAAEQAAWGEAGEAVAANVIDFLSEQLTKGMVVRSRAGEATLRLSIIPRGPTYADGGPTTKEGT